MSCVQYVSTHSICIKGGSKTKLSSFHGVGERSGVRQVGVRVLAPKVLQRNTVHGRVGRSAQLITEDPPDVWAHH